MSKIRIFLMRLLAGKTISFASNLKIDGNITSVCRIGYFESCTFHGRVFDIEGNEYIVYPSGGKMGKK